MQKIFSPPVAVFRLLQALQGISSDSKLLIELVVSHSHAQRAKIRAAYDPNSR